MYTKPEIPRVYAEKMQRPAEKQKITQTQKTAQTHHQETQNSGKPSPILLLMLLDLLS